VEVDYIEGSGDLGSLGREEDEEIRTWRVSKELAMELRS